MRVLGGNIVLLRKLTTNEVSHHPSSQSKASPGARRETSAHTLHERYLYPEPFTTTCSRYWECLLTTDADTRSTPVPLKGLQTLWAEIPVPGMDKTTVRWVAVQVTGILEAIDILPREDSAHKYMEPEPARIMWFKEFGPVGRRLLVSDLAINPDCMEIQEGVGHTEYSAPESLSLAQWPHSAVWTLGWVFLELLTWMIRGANEVDAFRE